MSLNNKYVGQLPRRTWKKNCLLKGLQLPLPFMVTLVCIPFADYDNFLFFWKFELTIPFCIRNICKNDSREIFLSDIFLWNIFLRKIFLKNILLRNILLRNILLRNILLRNIWSKWENYAESWLYVLGWLMWCAHYLWWYNPAFI